MNPSSLDIIIPVRNGGEPLARTLRALIHSADQDFRVVISDNYSTDGTPWKENLGEFRPGQVTLVQPPEPVGRVEHWSWAATQVKADYAKLLLCGDRFHPNYIGAIRRAFDLKPDIIYTPYIILGRGNTFEEEMAQLTLGDAMTPLSSVDYISQNKRILNLIGPLSDPTFRTSSLLAALPFDASHPWTADWRIYSRIMERGGKALYCEGTYIIQDRTIARLSSSFKGALNGIFEERDYRRELNGLPPAGPLLRWLTALRPVTGLALRHTLPPTISRPLGALARILLGPNT